MKVLLQTQGIEIECSCDEFQAIYPKLLNGHSHSDRLRKSSTPRVLYEKSSKLSEPIIADTADNRKVTVQTPRHQKSKERRHIIISDETYKKLIQELCLQFARQPFGVRQAARVIKASSLTTLYYCVRRGVKEGMIAKLGGKKGFQFQNVSLTSVAENEDNNKNNDTSSKQDKTKELSENMRTIDEQKFKEMLSQIYPLLEQGCTSSQIYKHFRNLKAKVIDEFLHQAISRGIIKEEFLGTLILNEEKAITA